MEEAFEVDIRALGTDGQGIGTLPSGKICFVEGVFPEETCLVRIISESSKFANCEALSVIRTSPSRVRRMIPVPGHNSMMRPRATTMTVRGYMRARLTVSETRCLLAPR